MNSKPTVAIVTNIAWNIYNFRRSLAKSIIEAGFNVIMISTEDEYAKKLREEGWNFISVKNLERTGTNPVKDILLFFEFKKIYKQHNIICCLHYNSKVLIYASLAASYLNIPFIPTITGLAGPFSGNRYFISKVVILLYKISLRKSFSVVFQNKEDRDFFKRKKIIRHQPYVMVPGSGVNMELFNAENYPDPEKDKIVFLMPARLSKAKGLEYYVDAAKEIKSRYPDIIFRLVGPFDKDSLSVSRERLNSWVNNGIIEYLGVSDNIQHEISQAHAIVYPSYYSEGIPRALIESAAMSKPIITTDNVGCKEVVQDKVNGFLVPTKNSMAVIDACEKFINMNTNDKEKMGEASRKIALAMFDETKVFKEYQSLIKQCYFTGNN